MRFLPFLALIIIACQPVAKVYPALHEKEYAPLQDYDSFLLLELDTMNLENEEFLATIQIGESGMTVNCGFSNVMNLAEKTARNMGGNCMVIKYVQMPDLWSSCYRITAEVYRLDDPDRFKSKIYWNPGIKLKVSHFRGEKGSRPYISQSITGIDYNIKEDLYGDRELEVLAFFNCDSSYFVHSEYDAKQLVYQALLFDMTELHARKLRKIFSMQIHTIEDIKTKTKSLADSIESELQTMKNTYFEEVSENPNMQDKWNADIAGQLLEYDGYSKTKFKIH